MPFDLNGKGKEETGFMAKIPVIVSLFLCFSLEHNLNMFRYNRGGIREISFVFKYSVFWANISWACMTHRVIDTKIKVFNVLQWVEFNGLICVKQKPICKV